MRRQTIIIRRNIKSYLQCDQSWTAEIADGALQGALDKIDELDKFKRAEILTSIFGQGFSDEVARLASGTDEFRRNLAYAADESKWFGSLNNSYQMKLDDFWSQWQLVKNSLSELAIDAGTMGMPALKGALQEVRASFGDLAITAAERVIRSSLDRTAHEALISQVLEEGESLRRG